MDGDEGVWGAIFVILPRVGGDCYRPFASKGGVGEAYVVEGEVCVGIRDLGGQGSGFMSGAECSSALQTGELCIEVYAVGGEELGCHVVRGAPINIRCVLMAERLIFCCGRLLSMRMRVNSGFQILKSLLVIGTEERKGRLIEGIEVSCMKKEKKSIYLPTPASLSSSSTQA